MSKFVCVLCQGPPVYSLRVLGGIEKSKDLYELLSHLRITHNLSEDKARATRINEYYKELEDETEAESISLRPFNYEPGQTTVYCEDCGYSEPQKIRMINWRNVGTLYIASCQNCGAVQYNHAGRDGYMPEEFVVRSTITHLIGYLLDNISTGVITVGTVDSPPPEPSDVIWKTSGEITTDYGGLWRSIPTEKRMRLAIAGMLLSKETPTGVSIEKFKALMAEAFAQLEPKKDRSVSAIEMIPEPDETLAHRETRLVSGIAEATGLTTSEAREVRSIYRGDTWDLYLSIRHGKVRVRRVIPKGEEVYERSSFELEEIESVPCKIHHGLHYERLSCRPVSAIAYIDPETKRTLRPGEGTIIAPEQDMRGLIPTLDPDSAANLRMTERESYLVTQDPVTVKANRLYREAVSNLPDNYPPHLRERLQDTDREGLICKGLASLLGGLRRDEMTAITFLWSVDLRISPEEPKEIPIYYGGSYQCLAPKDDPEGWLRLNKVQILKLLVPEILKADLSDKGHIGIYGERGPQSNPFAEIFDRVKEKAEEAIPRLRERTEQSRRVREDLILETPLTLGSQPVSDNELRPKDYQEEDKSDDKDN